LGVFFFLKKKKKDELERMKLQQSNKKERYREIKKATSNTGNKNRSTSERKLQGNKENNKYKPKKQINILQDSRQSLSTTQKETQVREQTNGKAASSTSCSGP
jgi:superfamily II helicase